MPLLLGEIKEKSERKAARKERKKHVQILSGETEKKKKVLTKSEKPVKVRQPCDNNIDVKDFVVRRTTFKCLHQNHKL